MLKRKQIMFALAVFMLAAAPHYLISSQQTVPQLIYDGWSLQHIAWSHDSQTLVFIDENTSALALQKRISEQWQYYNTKTGVLFTSTDLPWQAELLNVNHTQLKPIVDPEQPSRTAASYLSPNKRYLVHISEPFGAVWRISLLDLATEQTHPSEAFGFHVFSVFPNPIYRTVWNRTNSAFVVLTRNNREFPYTVFHISDFSADLSLTKTHNLTSPRTDDNIYSILDVYALSDSGRELLVRLRDDTVADTTDPNNQPQYLMLWDVEQSRANQVFMTLEAKEILGATLSPNDESKILIVNKAGLIQYNRITNELSVIDAQVDIEWARHALEILPEQVYWRSEALFSPDGRWVTIHLQHPEGGSKLYILPTQQ